MEPQENPENVNITPENVRSTVLSNDYFKVFNLVKKVMSCESTESFLKSCELNQLIPNTMRDRRNPYGFNDEENAIWKKSVIENDTLYVTLAHGKTERNLENLNRELSDEKQNLFSNLNGNEINLSMNVSVIFT